MDEQTIISEVEKLYAKVLSLSERQRSCLETMELETLPSILEQKAVAGSLSFPQPGA